MRACMEIMWSLHAPRVRLETLARFAWLCYRILFEMTCYVISIKWHGCLLNRLRQTCSQFLSRHLCSLIIHAPSNKNVCSPVCVSEGMHILCCMCVLIRSTVLFSEHCIISTVIKASCLVQCFLMLVFDASSMLWPIKTMCLASH